MRRQLTVLGVLLSLSGCGDEGDDGTPDRLRAALSTTFSKTSPLCPSTTNWGAWGQTSLSTWDSDVKPVVEWIINRTKISSSTYSGHSPTIGRAADWRPHSREEGTDLANWFLANTKSGGTPLGIDYIIWQAQIYLISSGVKPMEDRGSFTQNHCDHIHISFVKSVNFAPASTTAWGDVAPPDAGVPPDTAPSHDLKPKPPPKHDAGSSSDQLSPDAGAPPPAASSEDLGAEPPSWPTPTATPPSGLVGGCALAPEEPELATNAWLFLLLALAAILRKRRWRSRQLATRYRVGIDAKGRPTGTVRAVEQRYVR